MSKLDKLKLASKKSLSCFLPTRMTTPAGASTLFPPPEPDDGGPPKPNGIEAVHNEHKVPEASVVIAAPAPAPAPAVAPQPSENAGREIVSYGVQTKEEEPAKAKVEEPEEILELKTPGFIRVFGCDNCEDSDTDVGKQVDNSSSSGGESDDESPAHGSSAAAHHPPPHMIPTVHLRVPMKNEDDVRKVIAALHINGVLEVACDLKNQIVKVTGTADPDRLLKKVKKVRRRSKLISYTDPSEMPRPSKSNFHSSIPPPPPPPPYPFPHHHPPPPPPPYNNQFNPTFHGPFPGPPHGIPSVATHPRRHYCCDTGSSPDVGRNMNARPAGPPPPPPPPFYRDEPFHPGFVPSNLRPSSPPHSDPRSAFFYHERASAPPSVRCATSPPRRRGGLSPQWHEAPHFRGPPPTTRGPSFARGGPRGPGAPFYVDEFQPVAERMMHTGMYH